MKGVFEEIASPFFPLSSLFFFSLPYLLLLSPLALSLSLSLSLALSL